MSSHETATITEQRKRGVFGWVFLVLFWLFQALMILLFVLYVNGSASMPEAVTDGERAGKAIGVMLVLTMLFVPWLVGTLLLFMLSYMTRGKLVRTVTTRRV